MGFRKARVRGNGKRSAGTEFNDCCVHKITELLQVSDVLVTWFILLWTKNINYFGIEPSNKIDNSLNISIKD